ncbi:hypothetical protein CPB85DRAFT_257910 [Mucidula mucida]|nr:hypothetical protein CPB85DRAFT_257910 [Mucidula mucida]
MFLIIFFWPCGSWYKGRVKLIAQRSLSESTSKSKGKKPFKDCILDKRRAYHNDTERRH